MTTHWPSIRSLILIGGYSTRLGSPKYLLPIPATISQTGSATPSLIHSINLHHMFQVKHGDPLLRAVTLSVRDDAQRAEIKDLLHRHDGELPTDLTVSFVQDSDVDSGPAAGLVAAWRLDSNAHWLIVGCGYPLMVLKAFEQLRTGHFEHGAAVTCYENGLGWVEPLLGVWSPVALKMVCTVKDESDSIKGVRLGSVMRLFETISNGEESDTQTVAGHRGGRAVYSTGVTKLKPIEDEWIMGVNTKEDLDEALKMLRSKGRWRGS